GFDALLARAALVDEGQDFVASTLDPVVDDSEAGLAERAKLFDGFSSNAASITVGADAFDPRKLLSNLVENLQQPRRRQNQSVAVAQEHPFHHRAEGSRFVDVAADELPWLGSELLVAIHVAVRAAIVAAAHGDLEQEAVRFARRAKNSADVIHAR